MIFEIHSTPWLCDSILKELNASEYNTDIRTPSAYADGFYINHGLVLSKYFSCLKFERKIDCLYSLEVSADSIFHAIDLASLAMIYLAATNKQPDFKI